jgi:TRAP-type C4-dicarboxylate transport system permease small subunit
MDRLVKRPPPRWRKLSLVVSVVLMLFATWLLLSGSWEQTKIDLDVAAPASRPSAGWLYGVGIVFNVSALAILLYGLY